MASYEAEGKSDEWYTPPYIFEGLGCEFDLDVASPGASIVPWVPAWLHCTRDSLEQVWRGFVWMNPPYGKRNGVVPWRNKFLDHGNGIALVPSRTGAPWWQEFAKASDAVLFVSPKIKFIQPCGTIGKSPGTGSTLFATGARAASVLHNASALGVVLT